MAVAIDDMRAQLRARARQRLTEIEGRRARYDADLAVFAADCLKIIPKEGGETLLRFNDVQRFVHQKLEEQRAKTGKVRALILKARKPGVSTYVEARFYHKVSRTPGLHAFILTHEQAATDTIFEMTDRFHRNNPQAPHTGRSNAKELVFDDLDSGFQVGTAGTKATGRGATPQLFHGSEVAHWPNAADHATGALQAVPDVAGSEIILESTANGMGDLFYNMCHTAMQGIGDYQLIFIPWFQHTDNRKAAPADWSAPPEWASYATLYGIDTDQLYWAYATSAALAAADGDPTDRPCWRFRQEHPATAEEAFRASREGSFIAAEDVYRARKATLPPQDHAPIVLGCDFATGGDGEGGDMNVFIDRQARVAGKHVFERFRDHNTVTVASRLASIIDRVKPAMVFMDPGGGGAQVYDILVARGYGKWLTLVNFGSSAEDDRRYVNKRAEMIGRTRDWLRDPGGAQIPDEDQLEAEITCVEAKEDMNQRVFFKKKADIRKKFGWSPDGLDALGLTTAETVHEIDMNAINPLSDGPGSGHSHGFLRA